MRSRLLLESITAPLECGDLSPPFEIIESRTMSFRAGASRVATVLKSGDKSPHSKGVFRDLFNKFRCDSTRSTMAAVKTALFPPPLGLPRPEQRIDHSRPILRSGWGKPASLAGGPMAIDRDRSRLL